MRATGCQTALDSLVQVRSYTALSRPIRCKDFRFSRKQCWFYTLHSRRLLLLSMQLPVLLM